MEKYSVSVALFDFIPVILNAVAMCLLALAIADRQQSLGRIAGLAAIAIPLGGACKPSWKLLIAFELGHYPWLENMLFILLAPGFVTMAFALRYARLAWQQNKSPQTATFLPAHLLLWLCLTLGGALLAVMLMPESRVWFFWLLAVTTLANISLLVQAVLAARWKSLGVMTSASFIFNLVAILALGGLSRLPDGEATAWIQQSVNLSAQAALLFGCWRLSKAMRATS